MTSLRGVLVAMTTSFDDDLAVDRDRFADHANWLFDNGVHGVIPNGSLGEYQTLTDTERADLVRICVEAASGRGVVVPGVGAYSGTESRRWAEQADEAGADGVMALPPNAYAADAREVRRHYEEVAAGGLPVIAYNNPFDTKVDLTPELLADIADIDGLVGVKEFSGDVKRVSRILELTPELDVYAGADNVVVEEVLMGAVGWVSGFPNSLPRLSMHVYELALAGRTAEVLPIYRRLVGLLAWDTVPQFVQAIKLSQEFAGRYGGPTRLPRLPLTEAQADDVRAKHAEAEKVATELADDLAAR